MNRFIAEKYNASVVCAGYNYRFGHKAQGDTGLLAEECKQFGIDVHIQDCVRLDMAVSSSVIRDMIRGGDVAMAAEYLGRPFSICGTVIEGRQLGRKMGFPTANMDLPQGIVIPKPGVYKTRTNINGEIYTCITNVGDKPTVRVSEQNCETHIIGFSGDLYGQNIEICFEKRLRDIVEFNNIEALKEQLNRDLKKVAEI